MARATHSRHSRWGLIARRISLVSIDGLVGVTALYAAMNLRFEADIPSYYAVHLPILLALIGISRFLGSAVFRLYRWSFRHWSLQDALRLAAACLLGTAIFATAVFFVRAGPRIHAKIGPPRSVVILEFFLAFTMTGGIRFAPRALALELARRSRSGVGKRSGNATLVVGGGSQGEMVIRDLQASMDHNFRVVGYIDDKTNPDSVLCGVPALGVIDDLPVVIRQHRVKALLIVTPRVPAHRIRGIHETCSDLGVDIRLLPVASAELRQLSNGGLHEGGATDRSQANAVSTTEGPVGRKVLVADPTGPMGSSFCSLLLERGAAEIVLMGDDDKALSSLRKRLKRIASGAQVSVVRVDSQNADDVKRQFTELLPQDVFFLGGRPPGEDEDEREYVKAYLAATRSLASAAEYSGSERFVVFSDADGLKPISVLRAMLSVHEELLRSTARTSSTMFCVVRVDRSMPMMGLSSPGSAAGPNGPPLSEAEGGSQDKIQLGMSCAVPLLQAAYSDFGDLAIVDIWRRPVSGGAGR